MYADVESLLVSYLTGKFNLQGVSAELPADVLDKLPFARVTRVSGGDDYVTDIAVVDIDVFDATRTASLATARQIHAELLKMRRSAINGALVDYAQVVTGPRWIDYEDANLSRYLISVEIQSRITAQSI